MKEELLQYLKTQPENYNKSSTRYLYKREPELWKWILAQTSFLPENAKPKQRIWHIINDNFTRPLCPTTGEFVKWFENRYLTYFSQSAKAKHTDNTRKRLKTYKEKTGFDSWNSKDNLQGYTKLKETHLQNWGGWSTETHTVYEKFIKTKSDNGNCRTDEQKSLLELYNEQVINFTKNSWYYFYSKINPSNLIRGKKIHLDHIYSRKMGFDNDIPAKIIGHWTNLRLIPARKNNGKSFRCDKTIEQLYEDYLDNGGELDLSVYKFNISGKYDI